MSIELHFILNIAAIFQPLFNQWFEPFRLFIQSFNSNSGEWCESRTRDVRLLFIVLCRPFTEQICS